MKFDKEFKEAISNLPDREKDKLLLRLLKRDDILAKQLYFELVSGNSKEERRDEMEDIVRQKVDEMTRNFYSVGYLLMDLRFLSGEITEHVKVAKDKTGEIHLNLLMLREALTRNSGKILEQRYGNTIKFCVYIISRTFKILVLIKSLHEDLQADFNDDLHELGMLIGRNDYLMRTAIHHGLDVNWLISGEIPDNIKDLQSELRRNGYLK